jgi:hypothetical protein
MQDQATIFRINPEKRRNELQLYIPYWALNFDELLSVTFANILNDPDRRAIIEKITEKKLVPCNI